MSSNALPLGTGATLSQLGPMKNADNAEVFDAACLAHAQIQLEDNPEARMRKEMRIHADARIGSRRSYQQYLENGRRKKEAALSIQSAIRGWQARTEFLAQKSAATKLQALARGIIARREFAKTKAAIAIQSMVRMHEAQQELKKLKEERDAATTIQSVVHMHLAQQELKQLKEERDASITIQSAVRVHQAQQELKRLRDERDAAFQELRDYVEGQRIVLEPRATNCTALFPCDSLIAVLCTSCFADPIVALDVYILNGALAGYRMKVLEIRIGFDADRRALRQRVNENSSVYSELLKLAKVAGVSVMQLDAKLPLTNLKTSWSRLKDLCSANVRDFGVIFELIPKLILHYEEPKVEKKALPKFDRENSNTWDIQPVEWAPELAGQVSAIESIPAFNSKMDALKTGSLSGRTITKGSVKKTGFVMHEHISGNCGIGFCYVHNGGNTVTPWIVDYASDRWQGNGYDWLRSGKKKGDPSQDLLPKGS